MSYEAEILADAPVLYLRLDEVGSDADGDPWPDSSGNGLDAVQIYDDLMGSGPTGIARGYTSPIETDGASREFFGWTNPNSPLEGISRLTVADDPLMQPTNDFTVECWIRPHAGMYSAVHIPLVGKGNSCGISFEFSASGERLAGYCYDTAGTLWKVIDTSFDFNPDHLDESFHVVVRRVGNSLSLFINGTLRGTTNISSGLGTAAGLDFFVHHTNGSHFVEARYDEAALYLTPLTADRILAHYEAAFTTNPLAGRADMRIVATLDGDAEPTPQLFPFAHNWESPARETLGWLTDVHPAQTDYEQRAGIRQRPTRTLEFDSFIADDRLRRRFHAYLFQNQRRTIYLGDWTEASPLTANAAGAATTLAFVSAGRGFEDGGLMAVFQDEYTFEIVEIDTVGPTSTTLAAGTVSAWTKGITLVVPVVRAVVADQLDFDRHTDQLEESTITFRVLAQDVPLAPRRNGTYTPRYTYRDLEVFDPFVLGTHNWNETGRGQVTLRTVIPESPAGIFSRSPFDTAPRDVLSYSFFLDSRDAISQFLAWAWSIQGRRVPVWVPTLQKDFATVSAGGTTPRTITVSGHDFTDFYQSHPARQDLALIYEDESMLFKRITSAAASGANDVLSIEQAPAISLTNLRCLCFLKLSRLQEDTIGLVWHTDTLVEVTLNFVDLLTSAD